MRINVIDQPQKIQGCSCLKIQKPADKKRRKIEICKFKSNNWQENLYYDKNWRRFLQKLILRRKRLDGADSKIKSAFNVRYFTEEKS